MTRLLILFETVLEDAFCISFIRRRVIRFDLELQGDGFGVATIVGVSFLWHQVWLSYLLAYRIGA